MTRSLLLAVFADGFHWAPLKGFHAKTNVFFGLRLLVHVGIASLVVACEERRSGLSTKITVDALLIDIEFA